MASNDDQQALVSNVCGFERDIGTDLLRHTTRNSTRSIVSNACKITLSAS
jgi:hypothetical protein